MALLTRNGPAVALLYKDPAKKKDGIFASIPNTKSIQNITLQTAKKLIKERKTIQKDGNNGKLIGKHNGKTIYAKTGRFGHYLVWNDINDTNIPEHTTAFVNKSITIEEVTLDQAVEWIAKAKITLRKVNNIYTVKYNPQYDSVYLSKPNSKSKGRPLTAPLAGFTRDNYDKINTLKVKDCDAIFEEKQGTQTPIKKKKVKKQTKKK